MPQYTVKSGDTLSAIGKQFGIDYKGITGFKSGNPNLIYPGEVLTIPGGEAAPPAPAPTPTSADQVTPYLQQFQQQQFDQVDIPEIRVPTTEEIKTAVTPETPAPEPLSRVTEFERLRGEQGVADLEKGLTDLKAQERDLEAAFREQRTAERAKPVPQSLMEGRISTEERAYLERQDYLGRQKARITDELNIKYNVINTYMKLMDLDYQDAVAKYDSEFKRNLSMYELVLGQEAKAAEQAMDKFKVQEDIRQFEIKTASANLTTMMNAIKEGNLSLDNLGSDQKLLINKLEIQAGLPIGLMSQVKSDPKANILFTTSNEGITQVGIRNADGTISVQSYGTRVPGKPTETDTKRSAISNMSRTLQENAGGDGYVSPDTYREARAVWIRGGYVAKDFDEVFRDQYANPENPNYGFQE